MELDKVNLYQLNEIISKYPQFLRSEIEVASCGFTQVVIQKFPNSRRIRNRFYINLEDSKYVYVDESFQTRASAEHLGEYEEVRQTELVLYKVDPSTWDELKDASIHVDDAEL